MPLLWGGACLALWLLLLWLLPHKIQNTTQLNPLFWLLLASLACMIAWRSRELANTLAATLCLLCIGFAARLATELQARSLTSTIAWGWLVAGALNSIFGLCQYFGWTAEPLGTAFGFLRQRNQLATLCNIALLALLYLWFKQGASSRSSAYKGIAAFACLLLTATLAATCSRAGLLELIILSLALLIYASSVRHRKRSLANQVMLLVALILASYALCAWLLPVMSGSPESILGRIAMLSSETTAEVTEQTQNSRRLLWSNTVSIISAQPMLGVGWRELAYTLRISNFEPSDRFAQQADHAHNLPLQLAAELGLPFTMIWFCLLAWLVLRYKSVLLKSPEQALASGVLTTIGVHSLLEYPLWYAPFQITAGLAAGLVFIQTSRAKSNPNNGAASLSTYGFAGIGLLCFCAYAAFDYHRVRQLFLSDGERSALYRGDVYAHAQSSWLFAAQVRFATFLTTPITPDNATRMRHLGEEVMHFSPEPLVVQKLVEAKAYALE
jgi:O-antigen ligase